MKCDTPITKSEFIADAIKRLKKVSSEYSELRKDLEKILKFSRLEPEFVRYDVTLVEVYPLCNSTDEGTLKGYAKIELGYQLAITGLRIVEREGEGLSVEFPPNPYPAHDGQTIVFTTSDDLKEHIKYSVIEKYLEITK